MEIFDPWGGGCFPWGVCVCVDIRPRFRPHSNHSVLLSESMSVLKTGVFYTHLRLLIISLIKSSFPHRNILGSSYPGSKVLHKLWGKASLWS